MRKRNPNLNKAIGAALTQALLAGAFVSTGAHAQDTAASAQSSVTQEVVVTGSRIRGAAPVGSSVIGMDRTDIETAAGVTTDRIIKELPQVLNLGVSEDSRGQSGGAGNIVYGNTINLHGIGPYATLILVDGHRTVSNSRSVDPSVIPSLGLERIDILADGASAVYGSDAIAGVVNLIPRRTLDGVDTSFHYGNADSFDEWSAGIAMGKVWSGGQFMVAYEHAFRSNLNGDDRDFFTSDQRASGGSDRRVTTCSPGTIRVGTTNYAIPAAGVTPATASSLVAGTSNLCDATIGQDLIPEQKYDSVNMTFTQRANDWFEFVGDGFYSKRAYVRQPAYGTATLTVPNTNAFFVQPPGTTATSYSINYNFMNDLPRDTQTGFAENWEFSPGFRISMPHDFNLAALYTYGKNDDEANTIRGLNNGALTPALNSNNPATAFDPYGLHRTSASVLAGLANQIFLAPTLNTFKGYEAHLDGPMFDLPGGSVRIAAGYEGQHMYTKLGLARGNPGTAIAFRNFTRDVDSAYLELYVPVFGASNAVPGAAKLEFTAAVRRDKYSDVGSTTNPKYGLNWAPLDSLKFRASYGTAFRAPLISEIYGNSNALFGQTYSDPAGGPSITGFALSGENRNLKPEEATTWTVGLDWDPTSDTRVNLTYFDVTYEKQVANYLSNLSILGLENEFAGTGIILRGAAAGARVAELFNVEKIPLARGAFPGGNPANATLFVDGRNNNLGTSITRGIDFEALQRVPTDAAGTFTFSVAGTYLTKFESSLTPNGTRTDRLNTIFFPLKLKARADVMWDVGPLSTDLRVNYVNAYDNNQATSTQRVDAYTPLDLMVTLHGDDVTWLGDFGRDLSIGLEIRNLLDEDPPFVDIGQSGNGGGGFDPTTTNPVGRLIGLRIRKNWR